LAAIDDVSTGVFIRGQPFSGKKLESFYRSFPQWLENAREDSVFAKNWEDICTDLAVL
jgi:hypothetical protein